MTVNDTNQKPRLQLFLEDTMAFLGPGDVQTSDPVAIRRLLVLCEQGKTPEEAAAYFTSAKLNRATVDHDAALKDAVDGLRNHAYFTEQYVRVISEGITESMLSGGPVTGLLNASLSAQELCQLKGALEVYQDFDVLLNVMYETTSSAELALAVSKEDALNRLVSMSEAPPKSEGAGALQALKSVIKILTNTL